MIPIDVHREWKNCVVTFGVMSQFFHFLGASRCCADFHDPTAVFRLNGQDTQFIAGQLQEGSAKTQSELILAGIRRLEEDDTRIKSLRRMIDKREQSGEPVRLVLEDFLADMHKKYNVE